MNKDQKGNSNSDSNDSDELPSGGSQSCMWGTEVVKHGETVCDTKVGRKKRCNNGTWEDTQDEC